MPTTPTANEAGPLSRYFENEGVSVVAERSVPNSLFYKDGDDSPLAKQRVFSSRRSSAASNIGSDSVGLSSLMGAATTEGRTNFNPLNLYSAPLVPGTTPNFDPNIAVAVGISLAGIDSSITQNFAVATVVNPALGAVKFPEWELSLGVRYSFDGSDPDSRTFTDAPPITITPDHYTTTYLGQHIDGGAIYSVTFDSKIPSSGTANPEFAMLTWIDPRNAPVPANSVRAISFLLDDTVGPDTLATRDGTKNWGTLSVNIVPAPVPTDVPEPSVLGLAALGGLTVAFARRRKSI